MNRKVLEKALKEIGDNVPKATKKGFNLWGRTTLGKFEAKQLNGRPGLHKRTGTLSRSFKFKTTGTKLKDIQGSFSTNVKYAAIHESGGTVKAKAGKMLAIPIPGGPALTPAGVSRYASPLRKSLPGTHHFFVHKAGSGKLYLLGVEKGVADTGPVAWFALKKSVFIPKRLHLQRTIKNERDALIKNLGDNFKRGGFNG